MYNDWQKLYMFSHGEKPQSEDPQLGRIKDFLLEDEIIKGVSQKGNCRRWTRRAMDVLQQAGFPSEAREVDVGSSLSHTFVRLEIDEQPYIIDGVGIGEHGPYYGLEQDAPEHLHGSHPDVINRLLKL